MINVIKVTWNTKKDVVNRILSMISFSNKILETNTNAILIKLLVIRIVANNVFGLLIKMAAGYLHPFPHLP